MSLSAEDFIPSLAGYVQSLPIITALRLCNRYGQGSAAFVNTLPTEIIDLIEAHVHVATRQSACTEWEQQKNCTEGNCACFPESCEPFDPCLHRHKPLPASCAAVPIGAFDRTLGLEIRSLTRTTSSARSARLRSGCAHHANVRNFALRTRDFRALESDARLVKKYFGLNVWTPIRHSYDIHPDDIRLRPRLGRSNGMDASMTPKALLRQHGLGPQLCLMLPGSTESRSAGSSQIEERLSLKRKFEAEPCPDWKMMRRFLRVFRTLGLQTHERLRLLERVVNLVAHDSGAECNRALQDRFLDEIIDSDEGIDEDVLEGKLCPDILHVERRSSWESRLQTGWLTRNPY